ncbi:uncharacterized protein A4U43_C04F22820 [Asparagus officinalis]|uniref:Uncharacterized protein n=1 Tax=Asparagus officinalis TaxID=4686 RepID=A0A5P1F3N0_ASPOF|nr:uncharacterized protein A4U43_C04F22820 [Asparagus officinalis]
MEYENFWRKVCQMRIRKSQVNILALKDNDEKQVDYGNDDTDAYLTEPEGVDDGGDVDDEPDFGAMGEVAPSLFSTRGHFEPVFDFEGAFRVLKLVSAIDITEAPTPAPIPLVH